MPLTTRTNGTGGGIVSASWWNDFKDFLTGVMVDQLATIKNTLQLKSLGADPAAGMTATVVAGTGLGIGAYSYQVAFLSADGESKPSPSVAATTTSGNQKVNLAAIPLGPAGTTARRIYRTAAGGVVFSKQSDLADNTSTTLSDTTADAALVTSVNPDASSTLGGSLKVYDAGGVLRYTLTSEGQVIFSKAAGVSNQLMDWQQGYGLWSDNVGDGDFTGATTRLYFDTPNNGTIIFGGRASANILAGFRVRAKTIWLDDGGVQRSALVTGESAGQGARRVYIGTATPTGQQEGDIWVKA